MKASAQTVAEYLAPLSQAKRTALQKLRRDIKAAAPKAKECIAYGIPSYRVDGRMMVSFGAAKNHCSFYAGSAPVIIHKRELKAYDSSKGTVRFPADSPLPAALVRKMVRTQIAARTVRKPAAKAGAKRRRS